MREKELLTLLRKQTIEHGQVRSYEGDQTGHEGGYEVDAVRKTITFWTAVVSPAIPRSIRPSGRLEVHDGGTTSGGQKIKPRG